MLWLWLLCGTLSLQFLSLSVWVCSFFLSSGFLVMRFSNQISHPVVFTIQRTMYTVFNIHTNIVRWCLTGKSMWANTIKMNAKWPCVACNMHTGVFVVVVVSIRPSSVGFSLLFLPLSLSFFVSLFRFSVTYSLECQSNVWSNGLISPYFESKLRKYECLFGGPFFFSTRSIHNIISCKHIKTHKHTSHLRCHALLPGFFLSFFSHFNYIPVKNRDQQIFGRMCVCVAFDSCMFFQHSECIFICLFVWLPFFYLILRHSSALVHSFLSFYRPGKIHLHFLRAISLPKVSLLNSCEII